MRNLILKFVLFLFVGNMYAQTTVNPNTGNAYLLFGPNSSWGQYFQVGGNGKATSNASIFTTNGNLHLDSKNTSHGTYLNHYSKGNTYINTTAGKVGIGTSAPVSKLSINIPGGTAAYPTVTSIGDAIQTLRSSNNIIEIGNSKGGNDRKAWILARHSDAANYGRYYSTLHLQPDIGNKSQYRGVAIGYPASTTVSLGTHMAVNGNVGIETTSPKAKLDVGTFLSEGQLGTVMARLQEGNTSGNGTYLGVKAYKTQGNISSGIKSFALEHSFYGVTNSSINFYRGGGVKGGYITFNTSDNIQQMCIKGNGNVGIGTTTPDAKLTVKGNIHTQEVKVDLNGAVAPDYVFKEDYKLKSLDQVQAYINENGHLPNIPSATEMEKEGVLLKEMNLKLLEKIEELTLYTLEQQKEIEAERVKNKKQDIENENLKKRLQEIENILTKITNQ